MASGISESHEFCSRLFRQVFFRARTRPKPPPLDGFARSFGAASHGPLFRRMFADGNTVDSERLADKHVARLVKRTALAAGVRGDLAEGERARKFSGHSLRAGLASSAEIDERFVQKQLGHASAEMTRRYQRRRDRFRVNLTKAAGL